MYAPSAEIAVTVPGPTMRSGSPSTWGASACRKRSSLAHAVVEDMVGDAVAGFGLASPADKLALKHGLRVQFPAA